MEIGKTYYYETRGGTLKSAVLLRVTKAWYVFANGDWVESYRPIYRSYEEYKTVSGIVAAMERNIYVPDVIHIPNRFLK